DAEILRADDRDDRDRARLHRGQVAEDEEECRRPAVGFLEHVVLAARARLEASELGERERAEQRDHAADGPRQERGIAAAGEAGDVARAEEDADPDDGADHDTGGVPQPERRAGRAHFSVTSALERMASGSMRMWFVVAPTASMRALTPTESLAL